MAVRFRTRCRPSPENTFHETAVVPPVPAPFPVRAPATGEHELWPKQKQSDDVTRYRRASQIWTLLVCAAREPRTYTYGNIAGVLGFGGAGVMAPLPGCSMWFCQEKQLPPLTVLVVNQETGLPGEGLSTLGEVNRDRESVFNFNWFSIEPPQNADFK